MSAKKNLLKLITAFLLTTSYKNVGAQDLKIGIFSDIHLKLNYNPDSSNNFCGPASNETSNQEGFLQNSQNKSNVTQDPKALLGRIGCDAPEALVRFMFELFKKQEAAEPIDFILLTGDLIGHSVAQENGQDDPALYQLMKDTYKKLGDIFKEYFADIPIFITLGNNDCKYHYDAPHQAEKADFYDFLYNLWWQDHPANAKIATQIIQNSFKDGGYYRVDVSDKVTVLSFNSLPYNIKQTASEIGPEASNQFLWLESNLKEAAATGKKVIIFSHIYAGGYVKHDDTAGVADNWTDESNSRYFDLLLQYKDQVLIEIVGHDHWEDLRSYENKDGQIYRNQLISTGIGLDHFQLPGFSTLKVEGQTPTQLQETSVDITQSYGMNEIPPVDSLPKVTIDFQKDYGFEDLTALSINKRIKSFEDGELQTILNYLSDKVGFNSKNPITYNYGIQLAASWSLVNKKLTNADDFFCQASRARTGQKITECIQNLKEERIQKLFAEEVKEIQDLQSQQIIQD